jgi:hypothetical protein
VLETGDFERAHAWRALPAFALSKNDEGDATSSIVSPAVPMSFLRRGRRAVILELYLLSKWLPFTVGDGGEY